MSAAKASAICAPHVFERRRLDVEALGADTGRCQTVLVVRRGLKFAQVKNKALNGTAEAMP